MYELETINGVSRSCACDYSLVDWLEERKVKIHKAMRCKRQRVYTPI